MFNPSAYYTFSLEQSFICTYIRNPIKYHNIISDVILQSNEVKKETEFCDFFFSSTCTPVYYRYNCADVSPLDFYDFCATWIRDHPTTIVVHTTSYRRYTYLLFVYMCSAYILAPNTQKQQRKKHKLLTIHITNYLVAAPPLYSTSYIEHIIHTQVLFPQFFFFLDLFSFFPPNLATTRSLRVIVLSYIIYKVGSTPPPRSPLRSGITRALGIYYIRI